MQQETQTSKPSAGAIVAIVGGIMLAIGSFLTWATVSVDTTALLNKLATSPVKEVKQFAIERSRAISQMLAQQQAQLQANAAK